jgi:hypothetical protein
MKYFTLLLCFSVSLSYSQIQIQRSSINSFGSVVQKNNFILSQSAGQSSSVGLLKKDDNQYIQQGFQQPFQTSRNEKEIKLIIFPNPNDGIFSVQSDSWLVGSIELLLYDSQGRLCYSQSFDSGRLFNVTILNKLESGLYTLSVSDNHSIYSQKLIIQ